MTARRRWGVNANGAHGVTRPTGHEIASEKLSRQIDRPSQEAQIMVPRNFKTAKLLQVRREPLRIQQNEFVSAQMIH